MYPFGHLAVVSPSLLFGPRAFVILGAFVLLPDIDYLLPIERHGFTHSLLFVSIVLLLSRPFGYQRFAAVGVGSHMLIDALFDYGIVLFWPFGRHLGLELLTITDHLLILGGSVYYVYLNSALETIFFLASAALMAFIGYRKGSWSIPLLFILTGGWFYSSLVSYQDLPALSKVTGGEIVAEFGLTDMNTWIRHPTGDMWFGDEYMEFGEGVGPGIYDIQVLGAGHPSASLIVLVDGEPFSSMVSAEPGWHDLGGLYLYEGPHHFRIQQYDTSDHDSNLKLEKVRLALARAGP